MLLDLPESEHLVRDKSERKKEFLNYVLQTM